MPVRRRKTGSAPLDLRTLKVKPPPFLRRQAQEGGAG
jgi:hypothetical protein